MSHLIKEHKEQMVKALIGAITLQNATVSLDKDGELRVNGDKGIYVCPITPISVNSMFFFDIFWLPAVLLGYRYRLKWRDGSVRHGTMYIPRQYNEQLKTIFKRAKEKDLLEALKNEKTRFANALNLGTRGDSEK